jgi:predicted anti-sigma-YlaC factor YlaD
MSLMLTCKEAHQLTSEGMDRSLSVSERMRVRVHLTVCAACRNFDGQMQLIRRSMQALQADGDDKETP